MSSGNHKINSIIKNFAFHQSLKAIEKKFKKSDFVLDTVTVCVNKVLKTGSFPVVRNMQMLGQYKKKWTFLMKTSDYITTFIKSL